jgi:hypothetical protein
VPACDKLLLDGNIIEYTRMYMIGTRSDRVDLWDYHSKQHLVTLTSAHCRYCPNVYDCSSDGHLLAVSTSDCKRVIVWDVSNMRDCSEIQQLTVPSRPLGYITSVCFVLNTEQLIVGYDNKIALYDSRVGSLIRTTEVQREVELVHSFNDRIISVSRSGTVQEWDTNLVETRQRQVRMKTGSTLIAPSGNSLALPSHGSSIILDLVTLTSTTIFEDFEGDLTFSSLQINASGNSILAVSLDPCKVLALDVVSETVLFEFGWNGGTCFSLDGADVYTSSADGRIFCMDSITGSEAPFQLSSSVTHCGEGYDRLSIVSPVNLVLM